MLRSIFLLRHCSKCLIVFQEMEWVAAVYTAEKPMTTTGKDRMIGEQCKFTWSLKKSKVKLTPETEIRNSAGIYALYHFLS